MQFSRAVAVICCSVLVTALVGCSRESNSRTGETDFEGERVVDVDYAFGTGDYEAAIPLLQKRLDARPDDGNDWFRLGYALHSMGRLEEAIEAHGRAAEFPGRQKPLALYNWACALALSGRKDEAIDKLKDAIDAGFRRKKTVVEDPELDSLRKDERFIALLETIAPPTNNAPQSSAHTSLDFWAGDWNLEDETGRRVGRTTVTKSQNGYVFHEEFRADNRGTATSMTFFDPDEGVWKRTQVTSGGRIAYYTGEYRDSAMHFEGSVLEQDGKRRRQRVTLTPNVEQGTLSWEVGRSEDDGMNWEVVFRGVLRTRKPRL